MSFSFQSAKLSSNINYKEGLQMYINQQIHFENPQSSYFNLDLMRLDNQGISDDDIDSIFECIPNQEKVVQLKLNLERNNIGHKGMAHIVSNLNRFPNLFSLHIQLDDNKIGDLGLSCLLSALSEWQNLQSFSLFVSNNDFTKKGILCLESVKPLSKLQSLTLGFSRNVLGEVLAQSLSLLISNQKDLSELILFIQECEVGNAGAQYISKCLLKLKKLQSLQLFIDQNSMTDNGALTLIKNISELKEIKSLCFDICRSKVGQIETHGKEYFASVNILSEQAIQKIIHTLATQLNLDAIILNIKHYSNLSCASYLKNGYEGLQNDLILNKFDTKAFLQNYFSSIKQQSVDY